MMTDDTRTDGDVGRHGDAVVNGPEDDGLDLHGRCRRRALKGI
jgi:hypothetical protein